jgi:hypothetical protein
MPPFHQAGRLVRDFHDGGIVGQHGENRFAVSRRRFDRLDSLGAEADQRFQFVGGAIVNAEIMAAIEQALRHGLAHAAEPDKSGFHFRSPVLGILRTSLPGLTR